MRSKLKLKTYGEIVGEVLQKVRTENGYTQSDIATYLGIGASAYSQIEAGVTRLHVYRLKFILDFIGIATWDFFARVDLNIHDAGVSGYTVIYSNDIKYVLPTPTVTKIGYF
jgi:transcriptional regulator with XRE-family HTH domain